MFLETTVRGELPIVYFYELSCQILPVIQWNFGCHTPLAGDKLCLDASTAASSLHDSQTLGAKIRMCPRDTEHENGLWYGASMLA